MKFEPPPGSVFGGYGFWSYSVGPGSHPANGTSHTRGTEQSGGFHLRALMAHASRLLRWTKS